MKVSHAHENLFLYLCVHSLSCTIKWFHIEMVFVMVVRSSCLECRYFVIGFSICKNCSNIKSYPPLAKGIPLQLTLGNPYLTNHIGVDCCWPLVRGKLSHRCIDIHQRKIRIFQYSIRYSIGGNNTSNAFHFLENCINSLMSFALAFGFDLR